MPKYFEGNKQLPAEVVSVHYNEIIAHRLQRKISEAGGDCVISVKLPGLDESCLGYIFFVRNTDNNKYELRDINNVTFFRDLNIEELEKIIKHASGVEYNPEVQHEFYRIRNEIGLNQ